MGIGRALESAPDLPPLGPWNEFRDLAMDLIFASSRSELRQRMAADPRVGRQQLLEVLGIIERSEDADSAESALMKGRAKWVLWVLQRGRKVGYGQAVDQAPPLAATAMLAEDDPDLFVSWRQIIPASMTDLFRRYDRSLDIGDLEQLTLQVSAQADGEADVGVAVALQQAGVRWLERYGETGEPDDFAAATRLLARSIASFPEAHIGAAYDRHILSSLHLRRWQRTGNGQDAAEASLLPANVTLELPVGRVSDLRAAGCATSVGSAGHPVCN